jgi:hypothetical protein
LPIASAAAFPSLPLYKTRGRALRALFPRSYMPCTALLSRARRRLDFFRAPPLPAVSNPPSVGAPNPLPLLLLRVRSSPNLIRVTGSLSRCRTELHKSPPPSSSTSGRRRRSPPPPLPQCPSRLQLVAVVVSKLPLASFYFSPNRSTSCRSPTPRRPPRQPWCPRHHPSRLLEPVVGFAWFPSPRRALPSLKPCPGGHFGSSPASLRRVAVGLRRAPHPSGVPAAAHRV